MKLYLTYLLLGYFSHLTNTTFSTCQRVNSTIVNLYPISALPIAPNLEFCSSFQFPRAPVEKIDCLNDDPIKWMKLRVSVTTKCPVRIICC